MLLTTACALVLTFGFLVLLRAFPRQILHITLVLTILYTLGIAIWYFTQGYYSGAIVFVLFFIVFCFAYFGYRCASKALRFLSLHSEVLCIPI